MLVGNQQREGEAVQHSFGRALPVEGSLPNLNQLAGEGELVGVDGKVGAEARPQVQAAAG